MKLIGFVFICVSIVGCSAVPVQNESSSELCYMSIARKPVFKDFRAIDSELSSRNENCQNYLPAIQARIQANRDLVNSIQADLARQQEARQARQQQQQNRQINCTSTRYGNQVQTSCN
jgi:hypothetical protein